MTLVGYYNSSFLKIIRSHFTCYMITVELYIKIIKASQAENIKDICHLSITIINISPNVFKHTSLHCDSQSCPRVISSFWSISFLHIHSTSNQRHERSTPFVRNHVIKWEKKMCLRDKQICLQILVLPPPNQVSSLSLSVLNCPNGIKPVSQDCFMEILHCRIVGPSFS